MKWFLVPLMLIAMACSALGGESMEINNPPDRVPYLQTIDHNLYSVKYVQIGAWNLNTTDTKDVAHGLGTNWTKIVSVTGVIFDDGAALGGFLPWISLSAGVTHCLVFPNTIGDTNITLKCDTTLFSPFSPFVDPGVNRGYLLIIVRN